MTPLNLGLLPWSSDLITTGRRLKLAVDPERNSEKNEFCAFCNNQCVIRYNQSVNQSCPSSRATSRLIVNSKIKADV